LHDGVVRPGFIYWYTLVAVSYSSFVKAGWMRRAKEQVACRFAQTIKRQFGFKKKTAGASATIS
jgi:hypothetical protein